jgi:metal-sulfur cluster biosynthetic enzyme
MIVLVYLLLIVPVLIVIGIVVAVRRQSNITPSFSSEAQKEDAKIYEESTKVMEAKVEATVVEALAEKARDPLLATMSQEDLVFEVLKECYDPEIPLNIVDLGLIYEVQANGDGVNVKMSVTSPACPSGSMIADDIKMKLTDAGFPNPKVQIVMEPAWSPQRISEAGRKSLGI